MTERPHDFYTNLPAKRLGAGVLFSDESGRVLLVEPVYKPDWEVPGGLVELNESPRSAAEREVQEELGIEMALSRLWCVDWHPADAPATEGVMLLFDGGVLSADGGTAIALSPDELKSWAFCTLDEARDRLSQRLFRRVASCLAHPGETLYLENGSV